MTDKAKVRFVLELRSNFPSWFTRGKRTEEQGYTTAILKVRIKVPARDRNFGDYDGEAEIVRKDFLWNAQLDSDRADQEAADWAAKGIAKTLAHLWEKANEESTS